MDPRLSWDILADIRQLFEYRFMANAIAAGTVVAIMAGLVGWFAVLRRETFTVHTLAVVGFPGASLAALVGVSAAYGYVLFALGAAAVIALGSRRQRDGGRETAVVGTVQAVALSSGFLFISLGHQNVSSAQAMLFGSVLGVTGGQVIALAGIATVSVAVLAIAGRPLLFVSVDRDVAAARGVPAWILDVAFLGLLALAAATASQIVGSLLAFSLLVIPAATAQLVATRVGWSLALAVGFALGATWFGLVVAYYGDWPIGFSVPSIAFAGYLLARALRTLTERSPSARGAAAAGLSR